MGAALAEMKRHKDALACFAKAAELRPPFVEACANAGALCVKLGDMETAVQWCERALAAEPLCSEALFNINVALRCAGRQQQAVDRMWTVLAPSAVVASTATAAAVPSAAAAHPSFTVVCIKWGTKYGPEYVNKLAAGVWRHFHAPHTFVCFTDNPKDVDTSAVQVRPLPGDKPAYKAWWTKALLFSPSVGLRGRVLFLDLDIVIVGSLDALAAATTEFAVLSTDAMANERRTGGYNSSAILWDADAVGPKAVYERLDALAPRVFSVVHRFDHWLEMVMPDRPTLDVACPGAPIVEYQGAAVDSVPAGAAVVVFPLQPKPHDVVATHPDGWVAAAWTT